MIRSATRRLGWSILVAVVTPSLDSRGAGCGMRFAGGCTVVRLIDLAGSARLRTSGAVAGAIGAGRRGLSRARFWMLLAELGPVARLLGRLIGTALGVFAALVGATYICRRGLVGAGLGMIRAQRESVFHMLDLGRRAGIRVRLTPRQAILSSVRLASGAHLGVPGAELRLVLFIAGNTRRARLRMVATPGSPIFGTVHHLVGARLGMQGAEGRALRIGAGDLIRAGFGVLSAEGRPVVGGIGCTLSTGVGMLLTPLGADGGPRRHGGGHPCRVRRLRLVVGREGKRRNQAHQRGRRENEKTETHGESSRNKIGQVVRGLRIDRSVLAFTPARAKSLLDWPNIPRKEDSNPPSAHELRHEPLLRLVDAAEAPQRQRVHAGTRRGSRQRMKAVA